VDLLGEGHALVVSDIGPLNRDAPSRLRIPASWVPRNSTPEGRKRPAGTLRGHFKKMGCERIGRTPYYGPSRTRMTPTLADLLKPGS
jgi:hypothetical protein